MDANIVKCNAAHYYGRFLLPLSSGNSGWGVNGSHVFGSKLMEHLKRWSYFPDGDFPIENVCTIYGFHKVFPVPDFSRPFLW